MHARIPRGAVEVSRIPLSIDTGSCSTSVAMMLVYLTACVYEVLHDSRLRKVVAARRAFAIESALLGGIGTAALFLGGES